MHAYRRTVGKATHNKEVNSSCLSQDDWTSVHLSGQQCMDTDGHCGGVGGGAWRSAAG